MACLAGCYPKPTSILAPAGQVVWPSHVDVLHGNLFLLLLMDIGLYVG